MESENMRRATVEVSEEALKQMERTKLFEEIESLEVVRHLKHSPDAPAMVARVKPRENVKIEEVAKSFRKFEVLSQEGDTYLVYVEFKPIHLLTWEASPPKIYCGVPFGHKGGKMTVTLLGEPGEIKKLFRLMSKRRLDYRVVALTDAKFSEDSPLNALTQKQRDVLAAAYEGGYYSVPRRKDSDELAQKLGLSKSTFGEHLRKAEGRLIAQAFTTS